MSQAPQVNPIEQNPGEQPRAEAYGRKLQLYWLLIVALVLVVGIRFWGSHRKPAPALDEPASAPASGQAAVAPDNAPSSSDKAASSPSIAQSVGELANDTRATPASGNVDPADDAVQPPGGTVAGLVDPHALSDAKSPNILSDESTSGERSPDIDRATQPPTENPYVNRNSRQDESPDAIDATGSIARTTERNIRQVAAAATFAARRPTQSLAQRDEQQGAQEIGSATEVSQPQIDSTSRSAQASALVLINPAGSGGPIRFLLNEREFLLEPGASQALSPDRAWQVRFHRGGDFGNALSVVRDGTYEFHVTNAGWQLTRAQNAAAAGSSADAAP